MRIADIIVSMHPLLCFSRRSAFRSSSAKEMQRDQMGLWKRSYSISLYRKGASKEGGTFSCYVSFIFHVQITMNAMDTCGREDELLSFGTC